MSKLKIAVIGCGAVAEAHLAAMANSEAVEVSMLVDKLLSRAEDMARRHAVPKAVENFHDVIGKVDAAIVALPHHLHAPIATELLQKGVHVLVEKPMALNVAECDAMIKAAHQAKVVLAVGQLRRYFYSSKFVKSLIETGALGKIVHFEFREGVEYSWPAASDFTFRKESGGGVLADQGAHTLDLLLWWLGDYENFEYRDDSAGGVSADCLLNIRLKSGAEGTVELSRMRDLSNTCIVEGTKGRIQVDSQFNSEVKLWLAGQEAVLTGRPLPSGIKKEDPIGLFAQQIEDFSAAIQNKRNPFVTGEEARKAVQLINECYENRQPLEFEWNAFSVPSTNEIAANEN